jgi:hypothetical protein
MAQRWFAPWGWIYRPVSWQSIVLILLAGIFCVQVFVAIDRRSHSVSDTLIGFWPYGAPLAILWGWVASNTDGGAEPSR